MKRRRPPLAKVFTELNYTHFGGRLPVYTCRRWAPHIRFGCVVSVQKPGDCCHPRRVIRILGMLPLDYERQVLLHEMCHVATSDEPGEGHGPRWRAEMRRLAEHGEAWAAEAARKYEGPV